MQPCKSRVASRYLKLSSWGSGPPKEAIKSFEPFVKDPDDADMVAEAVMESFQKSLLIWMLPLPAKMKNLTWAHQESQTYGFDSRQGAWDTGSYMDLGGTISYPSLCTIKGNWKVNVARRWQAALQAEHARFNKPGWEHIPMPEEWVKDKLVETAEQAIAKMDTGREFQEGLEQDMVRCNEYEDDSDTTYYNDDGEEEEIAEGASADFHFTFRAKDPVVTVPSVGPESLVKIEIPVKISLLQIHSPWDYHARRSW